MRIVLLLAFITLGACGSKPSAADAKKFVEAAEADLLKLSNEAGLRGLSGSRRPISIRTVRPWRPARISAC